MKIAHRVINREENIVQVTTTDERVYIRDNDFANPFDSVTWILSYYPKSPQFYKWVQSHGDEADTIKELAGRRGSKIHRAVEMYLHGETVPCDLAIEPDLGLPPEELSAGEYSALIAFHNWYKTLEDVTLVSTEENVFNEDFMYAGTADLRLKIGETTWTIDLKTGSERPEHNLQVTAYQHTPGRESDRLAILYIGEKVRNLSKYKFVEVEEDWDTFVAVHRIFRRENPETKLNQYVLPASISINSEAVAKPKRKKKE